MMGNGEDLKENAKEKLYKYLCLLKLSSPFYNNIDSYINAILRTANISSLLCTLAIKAVRRFFIFLALLHFLSFCHHPPPQNCSATHQLRLARQAACCFPLAQLILTVLNALGTFCFLKQKQQQKNKYISIRQRHSNNLALFFQFNNNYIYF